MKGRDTRNLFLNDPEDEKFWELRGKDTGLPQNQEGVTDSPRITKEILE